MGWRFVLILLVACSSKQTPADAGTMVTAMAFGSFDKGSGPSFAGNVYFIPDTTQVFPDVTMLELQGTVYAPKIDIAPQSWMQPIVKERVEWFAVRYTGTIDAPMAGMYAFRLSSDDGSVLAIDGMKLIDNDGLHSVQEKTAMVMLTAGKHALQLDYFQGPRYFLSLQLWVTPPGGVEDVVKAARP